MKTHWFPLTRPFFFLAQAKLPTFRLMRPRDQEFSTAKLWIIHYLLCNARFHLRKRNPGVILVKNLGEVKWKLEMLEFCVGGVIHQNLVFLLVCSSHLAASDFRGLHGGYLKQTNSDPHPNGIRYAPKRHDSKCTCSMLGKVPKIFSQMVGFHYIPW